jgi:SAM-dependent methyltransferase
MTQSISKNETQEQQYCCPVCNSKAITSFLIRENCHINDNVVFDDKETAVAINRATLNLAFCEECGFIFNKDFELDKVDYGTLYDIERSGSSTYDKHIENLVDYLVVERNVINCSIVDVGCGSGNFLRELINKNKEGCNNIGHGFDTSYGGPIIELDGKLKFYNCYYGLNFTDIPVDVVISRHVIEHIPKPIDFLREIRETLNNFPQARLFFETPCFEWTLENKIFWDFFYEHCSYFSANSLTTAFQVAGFQVDNVTHLYGDQVLWLEASIPSKESLSLVTKNPGCIPSLAHDLAQHEKELQEKWKLKLQELVSKGEKIAIWGAAGKGTTFANLIDPESQWISCAVDLNPKKQGKYMVGTGLPIIGYEKLKDFGITYAIVANPYYIEENANLLKKANLDVKLLTVDSI